MGLVSTDLRLCEAMIQDAKALRYGKLRVVIEVAYVVDVRDGTIQGWTQEGQRKMTIRDLDHRSVVS